MNIFMVHMAELHPKTGRHIYHHCETRYESIEAFVTDLNAGILVVTTTLYTRATADRGVLEVRGRRPLVIGRSGVARIEIPRVKFVEFEDEENADARTD